LEGVLAGSSFAVNLLHAGAQRTAELFASGAPDRFDRVDWRWDVSAAGPHLVSDAHVVGDCEVSAVESVGDHAVVFGEVTRVSTGIRTGPLLYGLRAYRSWPQ
jgi:flavin reductase (DIM6/NTAB) family NADH-FMN oxidoreductase RutF